MKRRNYLPVLVAVSLLTQTSTLFAQWIEQKSSTRHHLNDVTMLDSATAIIVGDSGTMLRTTNAGTSWTMVPSGTNRQLNAIDGITSPQQLLYAVGDSVVCRSTDRGTTWIDTTMPFRFTAVEISPPYWALDVFLGTDSGKMLVSHVGSPEWSEVRDFAGGRIVAFGFRHGALNSYAMTVVTQLYTYSSWMETASFDSIRNASWLWDFIVGADVQGITHYLVGGTGDFAVTPLLLRRNVSDTAWTRFVNLSVGYYLTDAYAFRDTSLLFACGSSGKIVVSVDSANHWTEQITGITRNLRTITFADHRHGIAVGDSGTILFTENGGAAHPRTIRVPQEYSSIQSAISEASNGDTVLVSPGTYLEQINFMGKRIVVGSLYLTTGQPAYISHTIIQPDSGSVVTFSSGEDSNSALTGFTITGGTGTVLGIEWFGGGIFVRNSSPRIVRNAIVGNKVTIGCSGRGGGIAIMDSSHPLLASNIIMHNEVNGLCDVINYFGGGIWIDSTSNPVIGGIEANANTIDSNTAYPGRQAYRAGKGLTIDAQYNYWGNCPPDSVAVFPLSQFDVSNCLSIPPMGVPRKYPETHPARFALFQNYPNPFNPVTDVRYGICDVSHVSLKVYDVMGREVVTFVDEVKQPGEYVVQWNAGNVPSGVYFYRMSAGRFTNSKKMILAK